MTMFSKRWPQLARLGCAMFAHPASASPPLDCARGLVCASKPQSVIDVIKQIDPTATTSYNSKGVTQFTVKDARFEYDIGLTLCEDKQACRAVVFQLSFSDPALTASIISDWNRDRYLPKMYRAADGSVYLEYLVSTVGGLTPANFAYLKSFWESSLEDFHTYYNARPSAAPPQPAPLPPKKRKH